MFGEGKGAGMELKIHMQHGIAYNLLLVIPSEELDECLLSFPYWKELADSSYGYIRHPMTGIPEGIGLPASHDPKEGWKEGAKALRKYKLLPEEHLERLGLLDKHGQPKKRLILIGNRNLGNNPGFVAWHREKQPNFFHLKDDPVRDIPYSCLVWYKEGPDKKGALRIEPIKFKCQGNSYLPHRASDNEPLIEEIVWCTFGQQVLRHGKLVSIEEIIDQFYDIRHVLWFPIHLVAGQPCSPAKDELEGIYKGYPSSFKDNALRELRAGRPRSRFIHNAVGIASDKIIILQRHGTVEEIGWWLREAGAEDGLILDNGGSVFTWAWWAVRDEITIDGKKVVRTGNVIFSAPDWRPPTISLIAFVLKGPPRHAEPPGAISMAMV